MFYSHTFLAKKGPLGTVWIAAHLERRIKKPQIDAIDIPSYAERIMFPEVPIALRLSSHLLLGLVRIYSWKVNYLLQDCNSLKIDIKTVFSLTQIDLPEDADRAPFELVTKPDTFRLDAFELDDTILEMDRPDNNIKTHDQITMTDQILDESDPYVTVHIATEDNSVHQSPQLVVSEPRVAPMDLDVLPPFDGDLVETLVTPHDKDTSAINPGPSIQAEGSFQGTKEGPSPRELPEMEVRRDAVHNFENPPDLGDTNRDNDGMEEYSVPTIMRQDSLMGFQSASENGSFPLHVNPGLSSLDIPAIGISQGQRMPDLGLQPSPPVEKRKPRKRQKFFDESIVLSNAEMKKLLEDTTKLLCKRRKLPCSALDAWRFQKDLKNDCILHEPLHSGMCSNLQEVLRRSYPPLRVDFAPLEYSPEPTVRQPDYELTGINMEFEQPRNDGHNDGNIPRQMPSPSEREITPFHVHSFGLSPDKEMTSATEVFKMLTSVELVGPERETPSVQLDTQHLDDSELPEIPGLLNSADGEELEFLEASNTSSGYGVFDVDNMSARTRAVAQYFKELSPATENQENQPGNLSLNKILVGKTRKQSARMFFETLVLKSYGFIDVQQEAAYGDILVSPTPALTEAKF